MVNKMFNELLSQIKKLKAKLINSNIHVIKRLLVKKLVINWIKIIKFKLTKKNIKKSHNPQLERVNKKNR